MLQPYMDHCLEYGKSIFLCLKQKVVVGVWQLIFKNFVRKE
jgi:hypothetical protein